VGTVRRTLATRAHPVSTSLAVALAVAALALPALGCGEASSQSAAGASIAPAGAKLFVSLDTTFDSANWEAGRKLLAKFPDGDKAIGRLMQQLGAQGLDFEHDVKPAFGPETDLVGLDLSGQGKLVGLTQPEDRAKLDALLAKADSPLVSREIDGWVAFSDTQANLDEFESMRKDGTLDGVNAYAKMSDEVASDALVHVYVAPSSLSGTPAAGVFGSAAPSLAVSLEPEDDGIHVEGAASPAGGDLFSEPFKAELPGQVPGGVYLYAGTSGLDRQLGALRDAVAQADPNFDRDLARAEAQLGVSLDADVFPLFAGESALYIRPGFPIPEITIVTQVDDERRATATMDKLANALAEYDKSAQVQSFDAAGVQGKRISLNQFVSVYYAAFDGHLVITTSQQGIADLKSGDNRLADDQAFKDATSAAGMPDETTGFLYVDLAKALPAVFGLMGLSTGQPPAQLESNLEALHSLVLYGTRDGEMAKFAGVLSIQ
jgi:Protein of unknown function (DUF3352)